jgi:ribosomal protein S1
VIEPKHQVGDVIKGKVKNIKRYGAFIVLPIGFDGFVHGSVMNLSKCAYEIRNRNSN